MCYLTVQLCTELEEPTFLRRLRQGQAGVDHQQRYIAPRNRKRPIDDEEDAPTYVLEEGNETISTAEFKALSVPDKGKEEMEALATEPANDGVVTSVEHSRHTSENILEAGSKSNKRKFIKTISAEGEDVAGEAIDRKKRMGAKLKSKQKVKLSFHEDE